MSRSIGSLTIVLVLAGAIVTSSSPAQEQNIQKKDVPKPILEAFQKAYPKATIKGYSKETDQGTVMYEVESVEGKVHRDITYTADGSLVSIEESLPFSDLPQPVRDTIAREYPKAKISMCERVMNGSTTQFEMVIATGKQKYELVLNADGTVAKKEKK